MKLLICLSALTVIYAIKVPNTWTENNFRRRHIGYRNTPKRHLDKSKEAFSKPVISSDGWIPINPKNVIRHNHLSRGIRPVATTPVQKIIYHKPRQYPKKYVQSKNVGAIQQPYVIYNPFSQTEHRPIFSTPRAQTNFDRQLFPSNSHSLVSLRTNHLPQSTVSVSNFLQNLNVDQFLNTPKQQPKNDPFENFQVEHIFNNEVPKNHKTTYTPIQQVPRPLTTNYRDDRTHEPQAHDLFYDPEIIPKFERKDSERAPISSHEVPQDIPTKPIYPGEGQWAKKGQKHKPFISKHIFETLEEAKDQPDGYEVFQRGQNNFDAKNNQFSVQSNNFPSAQKLTKDENNIPNEESSVTEEFVPTRLYAQVRSSENEEHLPREMAENERLKEVIKDSKIQTVYSEEGYEDSAYDHAGHEKKAQDNEGFEEYGKETEKGEEKKRQKRKKNHKVKEERLPTSEEIERDKQQALDFPEDSSADFSQHVEVTRENNVHTTDKSPHKRKKDSNEFRTMKESKTTTTMDTGDGNTEMEINGEMKVILQPYELSKFQTYVKKYPTVHKTITNDKGSGESEETATVKELSNENATDIYIEEIFSHTTPFSIIPTDISAPGIINLEIPLTTLATTAIPKTVNPEKDTHAKQMTTRMKRSSDDFFPDISPDVDFIDKINHEFGTPKPPKIDDTKTKYPYYRNNEMKDLNENSPLRYAEDLANVPKKQDGRMAFYDQAESRVSCPEIVSTVEPIPERILQAEQEADEAEETESEDEDGERRKRDVGSSPRLGMLGDKINCLKVRYFGENPLDSPIFKEDTVGEVKPIFKIFEKNAQESKDSLVQASKYTYEIAKFNEDKDNNIEASRHSKDYGNSSENIETTTVTTINLITTPNYTIELKPKNIYDQIRLLNYLPEEEKKSNDTSINEIDRGFRIDDKKSQPILNNVQSNTVKPEENTTIRKPKQIEEKKINNTEVLPEAEQLNLSRRVRMKPKRPLFQIFDINKFLPTTQATLVKNIKPSQSPPKRLNKPTRFYYATKRPPLQIFDVNKFLPTTTPIAVESTVLPKYKVISEVFYKDDIKPNEQLNVFTDVLRNIKSSSEEEAAAENSVTEPSDITETKVTSTTIRNTGSNSKRNNKNPYLVRKKEKLNDSNYDSSIIQSATTSKPPLIQIIKPFSSNSDSSLYSVPHLHHYKNVEDKRHRLYVAVNEAVKKQKLLTTSEVPEVIKQADYSNEATDLMGLKPPKMVLPKATVNFKRDSTQVVANFGEPQNRKTNKYLVLGMKPPPVQKLYTYIDFINNNYLTDRIMHSRIKRSVSKPSYAQLSRGRVREVVTEQTTEAAVEEEDDYVPHRSKNYYYDEKLGKIVYLTTKKPSESEEEEEVEEVYEIVEEPRVKSTSAPKQHPIFATATPPPAGKSFVDFVKKLKSAATYQEIPDPLPTEQSQDSTQIATTTTKPISTTPPEFLNILAKIKTNTDYKLIEDKKEELKTSTKKSPVTEAAEIEEEVEDAEEIEEDGDDGDVQNSSGKQIHEIGNFGIFDITDYIPKIKNYLPKTAIDTSKYQTIQRQHKSNPEDESSSRHNNRSNADDEDNHKQQSSQINHSEEAVEERIVTTEQTDVVVDKTTLTTAKNIVTPTTETPHRQRGRGRFRNSKATTTSTVRPTQTQAESLQSRVINRRRKLRPQSTTEKFIFEETENKVKTVHRRSDPKVRTESARVEAIPTLQSLANLENEEQTSADVVNVSKDKFVDVEVFNKFDESKKHGGNYRRENPEQSTESTVDDSEFKPSKQKMDHLKFLTPFITQQENREEPDRRRKIDTHKNQSSKQPMRLNLLKIGNVRDTNWQYEKLLSDQIKKAMEIARNSPKRKHLNKPSKEYSLPKYDVPRLTDVVPKPDAFFTDPSLPSAINLLIGPNRLSTEEAEEIVATTKDTLENRQDEVKNVVTEKNEKGQDEIKKILTEKNTLENSQDEIKKVVTEENTLKNGQDEIKKVVTETVTSKNGQDEIKKVVTETDTLKNVEDEIKKVVTENSNKDLGSSTKKPLFIKDPSKRLYFYAPI